MKTEQLLIRLSQEELNDITAAFKVDLINSDGLLTRSEFIRNLIKLGLSSKSKQPI